jgi:hypothetical protein
MASIVPDFRAIRAVYGIDRAKTQGSGVLGKGLGAATTALRPRLEKRKAIPGGPPSSEPVANDADEPQKGDPGERDEVQRQLTSSEYRR